MSGITLTVPDDPGPGEWEDGSGLGPNPLASIVQSATAGDQVRLETSASASSARVTRVVDLGGADLSPQVINIPVAQVRAVRLGGPTTRLTVVVTPTNQGRVAGAMSGFAATNGGGQPITDAVPTPLTSGWTLVQPAPEFDAETGIFTASKTTYHQLSATIGFNGEEVQLPAEAGCAVSLERSTDGGSTWTEIAFAQNNFDAAASHPIFTTVSWGYPLNAGDQVRVTVETATGGTDTTLFPVGLANLFSAVWA